MLVGIGVQLGDVDLGIVTTVGFAAGARDVAVDRNVAMVRLRPYDPTGDEDNFIRRINLTLNVFSSPIRAILARRARPQSAPCCGRAW